MNPYQSNYQSNILPINHPSFCDTPFQESPQSSISSSSWGYLNSSLDGLFPWENPHRSKWMTTELGYPYDSGHPQYREVQTNIMVTLETLITLDDNVWGTPMTILNLMFSDAKAPHIFGTFLTFRSSACRAKSAKFWRSQCASSSCS